MLRYAISINTMEISAVMYSLVLLFRVTVWYFKIKKQALTPGNPYSNYGCIHAYI